MSELINDLICRRCGDTGPDVPFPLFPIHDVSFGQICARCDEKEDIES